jgi:hypothetical protein
MALTSLSPDVYESSGNEKGMPQLRQQNMVLRPEAFRLLMICSAAGSSRSVDAAASAPYDDAGGIRGLMMCRGVVLTYIMHPRCIYGKEGPGWDTAIGMVFDKGCIAISSKVETSLASATPSKAAEPKPTGGVYEQPFPGTGPAPAVFMSKQAVMAAVCRKVATNGFDPIPGVFSLKEW